MSKKINLKYYTNFKKPEKPISAFLYFTLFLIIFFGLLILFAYLLTTFIDIPNKLSFPYINIPDEYISAIAGLFGVVLGVVITEYNSKEREKKKTKRELVDNITILIKDFKLLLIKIKHNKLKLKETEGNYIFAMETMDLLNSLNLLNIKLWDAFEEVKIKAAMNRLINSISLLVNELDFMKNNINMDILDMGDAWISTQHIELKDLMLESARVKTKIRQFPQLFIKAKNVNPEYMEKMDFEIHAPPWEPYIGFYLIKEPDEETKNQIKNANYKRIKDKKCAIHKQAAHIYICGYSVHSSKIYVKTCCKEFQQEIFSTTDNY